MGCHISTANCPILMQSLRHLDVIQFDGFDRNAKVTTEDIQMVKKSWTDMLQPKPIDSQPDTQSPPLSPKQSGKSITPPHTLFYNHFYGYLHDNYPETEIMFAGSGIKSRADSLIRMISSAVSIATQPPTESEDSFRRCAEGHAAKGINSGHFSPVVNALIHALTQMLGDAFTPTIKQAWLTVFSHAIVKMAPNMAPMHANQTQAHSVDNKAQSPLRTATVAPLPATLVSSGASTTMGEWFLHHSNNQSPQSRHPESISSKDTAEVSS